MEEPTHLTSPRRPMIRRQYLCYPKRSPVLTCHRLFLRLETHLRKNSFCKAVKFDAGPHTSQSQAQPPLPLASSQPQAPPPVAFPNPMPTLTTPVTYKPCPATAISDETFRTSSPTRMPAVPSPPPRPAVAKQKATEPLSNCLNQMRTG